MPASPSTARAINDRLALRLLQHEGPLTAGQLKQLTGLSRPTVADLVERLTASGLIEMVGESGEQRRGPNARLYGIVGNRAYLAALDVRTEGVSVLVSDLVGRVLAEASVPIDGDSGTGPAVEQAVALVERAAKEAGAEHLHTVCVGAPGLIDPATGELRDTTGLPAWHRRLVAALHERLPDTRIVAENETNLAALAERRDGAAHDRDTFVLLWLGMGIGAAVVLDGMLRRGASGGAGEIGFLPVPGTRGFPSATDCEGVSTRWRGPGLCLNWPGSAGCWRRGGRRGTARRRSCGGLSRSWAASASGVTRASMPGVSAIRVPRAAVSMPGATRMRAPTPVVRTPRETPAPATPPPPASWTPSPTVSPSVSLQSSRCWTPDAWSSAARSGRPAVTNSPYGSPSGSSGCPRCPQRCARASSAAPPCCAARC